MKWKSEMQAENAVILSAKYGYLILLLCIFFLVYKPLLYHKAENFFFFDYKRTLVRLSAGKRVRQTLTLIGMREGTFHPLSILDQICQLIFDQKFPNFFKVKMCINQVNLTPCQAHWVLKKCSLSLRPYA